MTEKLDFKARIKKALEGGDDKKIDRFIKSTERFFAEQKKLRQDAITVLEDEIIDAEEELQSALDFVEISKLKDAKSISEYSREYVSRVKNAKDNLKTKKDKIKILKAEIDSANELQELIFAEVEVEVEASETK